MLQKPATKQPFFVVPGYSRLFRRGAIYYFRVGVPNELRKAIGKTEIIKSLRTTNFSEAKRLVALESATTDARFTSERRKLNLAPPPRVPLPSLSEAEIHRLVVEWFIGIEKASENWWATSGKSLEPEELEEWLDTLRTDETVLSGGSKDYAAQDGRRELNEFLQERGVECPSDSSTYKQLCEVFRRGRLETIRRSMDRIIGRPFQAYDPLLDKVFAHSLPPRPPEKSIKLGEFLDRFLKFIKEKRADTTFTTYQTPVRVMRDVLGEKTDLNAITRESVEKLCEALKNRPKNAQQRYRGLSGEEAIAAATRRGDTEPLKKKTLENYFRNIQAVFNFAVDEGFLKQNPANYRALREEFRVGKKGKPQKKMYSREELTAIFQAPIFTGCLNDERGYAKKGDSIPRRGRFWVLLLALFQGLRCNEACQLYAEDVKEKDGIAYLAVRTELDDEELTDKRLKNFASIRNVPIHPILLKMGFLEFVAARRKDANSNRLFPELPMGKTKRYSNPFSKWYGRFLKAIFGKKPKGTFHSFRHHFRDALREQRIGDENAEALGGWAGEEKTQREYGIGPRLGILFEDISKVEYPHLDLRHLYK